MRHYNKEKTFGIIKSDVLAPKEQIQEPNNNQTVLGLRKATEWEKDGFDYPLSSLYLHSCTWSKICTSWICHLKSRDNFCIHKQKFKNVLINQPLLLREYFCESSTFMMLLITRYIMAFAFSINSGHFIIKCLRYDVMRRQRSYDE